MQLRPVHHPLEMDITPSAEVQVSILMRGFSFKTLVDSNFSTHKRNVLPRHCIILFLFLLIIGASIGTALLIGHWLELDQVNAKQRDKVRIFSFFTFHLGHGVFPNRTSCS